MRSAGSDGDSLPSRPASVVSALRSRTSKQDKLKSALHRVSVATEVISMCAGAGAGRVTQTQNRDNNGWQANHVGIQDRVSFLFNSYTMSDIIFYVGSSRIPAHRFILASASPVLHHRLNEAPVADDGGKKGLWRPRLVEEDGSPLQRDVISPPPASMACPLRVAMEVRFDAFIELLRFLYTDDLTVTLDNVTTLIFMADDFKLPSLLTRCFTFLRSQVQDARNSLKILGVVRSLMSKAIICLWRDEVERRQALAEFKELNMVERQRIMAELQSRTSSRAGSRNGSRAPSRSGSMVGSRWGSRRNSFDSNTGLSRCSSQYSDAMGNSVPSQQHSEMGDSAVGHIIFKPGGKDPALNFLRASKSTYLNFVAAAEELSAQCAKLFREATEVVLSSPDWKNQDLRIVRTLLSIDTSQAPEIFLFRALSQWADQQCRVQGLPMLPEYRRQVIGKDTILLIRFPAMTIQEVQWEVVPTGLLEFEDVRAVQQAILTGQPSRFDGEPRGVPMESPAQLKRRLSKRGGVGGEDMLDNSDDSGGGAKMWIQCDGVKHSKGRAHGPSQIDAPAQDDPLHAVLQACLWRSNVDALVAEQAEVGRLAEAQAFTDTETGSVLCASPVHGAPSTKGGSRPTRHRHCYRSPLPSSSPMVMLTHPLSTEAGSLPAASEASSAQPQPPPGSDMLRDFKRVAPGFYRFRGARMLEIRLEQGQPMVYEDAGGALPATASGARGRCGSAALAEDAGARELERLRPEEVRSQLGLPKEMRAAGVPLESFVKLSRWH